MNIPLKKRKQYIQEMFSKVVKGDLGAIKTIIQKMYEFELAPKDYVLADCITTSAMSVLNDDQKKLLDDAPNRPTGELGPDDSNNLGVQWTVWSEEDRRTFAIDTVDRLFRRGYLHTDTSPLTRVFKVLDDDRKVCSEVKGDRAKVNLEVSRNVGRSLVEIGMESPPGIINTLRDYWDIYGKTLGNDEDLAGSGVQTCYADIFENEPEYKDIWSLYKSPHKPDASVPFPKLKETIDRMSEGDAFAAWIWGTYSQVYQGRQIFWVYGPEGEEGKSYLGKFLGKELFGENAGYRVINNLKTKSRNQFTTAAYIGAKLIVYPDCNDRRVLWTELFKSLAGGGRDSEVVEEKYGSSNTVTLDARGIIISNQLPELKRENWLLSRLALCRIDPMKDKKNPNIDKIYLEELPGFLAYAKDCYERLCPDNEAIKLKPETKKWIEEIIDQQDPWLKDVFVRYFELDNNSVVTFKRMKEIMELSEGMKGMDYKNWCEWLTHQVPGVTIVKRSNGFCFKGIYESKEGKVVLTTNVNEAFKEIDARMEQTITFEEMEEAFKDVT